MDVLTMQLLAIAMGKKHTLWLPKACLSMHNMQDVKGTLTIAPKSTKEDVIYTCWCSIALKNIRIRLE